MDRYGIPEMFDLAAMVERQRDLERMLAVPPLNENIIAAFLDPSPVNIDVQRELEERSLEAHRQFRVTLNG